MPKLRIYESEGVDRVVMVVPDEFDKEFADEEARNFVSDAYLIHTIEISENDAQYFGGNYRPYVG